MNAITKKLPQSFFFLLIATALFAFASPVLKLLIEQGAKLGITHPDAISFCNVLFVGNFCAGLVTFLVFPKRKMLYELKRLDRKTTYYLSLSCILAIIYPSLIFFALEKTTVTQIVLVSRFEGIVYAIFAFIFLKQKLKLGEALSYLFIAIGVAIVIFQGTMMISKADLLVLSACVAYGFSEVISFKLLDKISLQTFIFVRNFFSAIVFFLIATYLFGPKHFAEAFYGDLWISMLIYAGLIIVVGQLMWFRGVKHASTELPTNFALITPFFTIFFAYLLLGEKPDLVEWIAIIIIAIGIIMAKVIGKFRRPKLQPLGVDCGLIGR